MGGDASELDLVVELLALEIQEVKEEIVHKTIQLLNLVVEVLVQVVVMAPQLENLLWAQLGRTKTQELDTDVNELSKATGTDFSVRVERRHWFRKS
jgi:hypothetical protein